MFYALYIIYIIYYVYKYWINFYKDSLNLFFYVKYNLSEILWTLNKFL